MATDTLPQVLRDWVDAQNEHDSAKHASLYASDGILEDVANGFAAWGHDEIAAFLGKADAGLGDVDVDVTNSVSPLSFWPASGACSAHMVRVPRSGRRRSTKGVTR